MIEFGWLIPTALFSFLAGLVFGGALSTRFWKSDCIRHGVARYHPQTGKWEWTVEEKE